MKLTVGDLLAIEYVKTCNLDELGKRRFSGVSTDSRKVRHGEVFIALRGEAFDGLQFMEQAFARGAACAVVDRRVDVHAVRTKSMLIVQDTAKALGELANVYRKKFDIPMIAIAGSNGKTTTKEMVGAVLGTTYTVLCTKGNLNNHIGVPQTLFRLNEKHEAAVVEVGTNHFGELTYLCDILEPTHGLITNIGREHLEFFKNLAGVSKAEGELFSSLRLSGIGYVNDDDKFIREQAKKLKTKISYGFSKTGAHIIGKYLGQDAKGRSKFSVKARGKKKFDVQLSIPGKHATSNALAAAAVGISFGVSSNNIQRALRKFVPVSKRMEVTTVGGVTILNDTYNANPDSVLSALETLQSMRCKGKRVVILADMLELGNSSKQEHEKIGDVVSSMGFEYLLTYGPMAKSIFDRATTKLRRHFKNKDVLSETAAELLSHGDIVLVKGSRGMKMENVVSSLIELLESKSA